MKNKANTQISVYSSSPANPKKVPAPAMCKMTGCTFMAMFRAEHGFCAQHAMGAFSALPTFTNR